MNIPSLSRVTIVLAVVLMAPACDRGPGTEPVRSPDTPLLSRSERPFYTPEQTRNLETAVVLLAEALGDREAREALYRALSASPYSEGKVVLADLLLDPKGRSILDHAAARGNTSRFAVDHVMAGLPAIDLYIPHAEHRKTWQPSKPIAVATLANLTSPVVGHLAGGGTVAIDRRSTTPTDVAVLLLGPAEPKVVRQAPQAPCSPDQCGGDGGGGAPPPDTKKTYVTRIVTHNVCDNGFCWETNEFEFRGVSDSANHQSPVVRCTEIGPDADVNLSTWPWCTNNINTVVHNDDPSEGHKIDAIVVETDMFGDDVWKDWFTPPAGFVYHTPYLTPTDPANVCCYSRSYALYEQIPVQLLNPPQPVDPAQPFVEVRFTWPTKQ